MTETTTACPACDGSRLRYRVEARNWICRDCGEIVDEPVERERKKPGRIRGDSVAGQLEQLDPEHFDELTGDGL